MALFPRWSNTIAQLTSVLTLVVPVLVLGYLMVLVRTPFVTNQHFEHAQPVQFDHRHHSWEQGIDCRFCHTAVETSANAGIPSISVCIGCHGQVWNKSPRLEPVRQAFFSRQPIAWVKVHDLPDFVYFNHSIHVNKGVGCATCHGRVDKMPTVRQMAPLTMTWCLDCHRDPAPNLRPKSEITNMLWEQPVGAPGRGDTPLNNNDEWQPPRHDGPTELQRQLLAEYDVHPRDSCDTCHR